MHAVLSILLFAMLLCGCGSGDSSTETGGSSSESENGQGVELTYRRSGGFAPIDETLRIHRTGAATLTEGRTAGAIRVKRIELGPAQRRRLAATLKRVHFDELDGRSPSGCTDCFVYELATPANALRFDQAAIPRALRPVIARLDAIVAAHRPGG